MRNFFEEKVFGYDRIIQAENLILQIVVYNPFQGMIGLCWKSRGERNKVSMTFEGIYTSIMNSFLNVF
jgi:hypothetical protein